MRDTRIPIIVLIVGEILTLLLLWYLSYRVYNLENKVQRMQTSIGYYEGD